MIKQHSKFLTRIGALFLTFLLITPAYATIPSEEILDTLDTNGIYYYNPVGNFDACNTSATKLTGDTIEEKVWNFFIDNGFTDAQAAGIIGNAWAESGIEPTRASTPGFWGMFQWGAGRRIILQGKIRDAGLGQYLETPYWPAGSSEKIPETDLDRILQIELEHTLSETDLDWQEEIKTTNSPEEAAEIFLVLFERAVGGNSEILYYAPYAGQLYQATKTRRDYAREVFEKYSGQGNVVRGAAATVETGKNITIIGDSITASSTAAILKKFPDLTEADIDARVSRSWSEGADLIKTKDLKRIVIFALGTNTPNLAELDILQVISAIGPNHTIVFATNYDNTGIYGSNNYMFKELAKNNSNIAIADWATTVGKTPEVYLEPDHIHPNQAGQELFADTLLKAINGNFNADGCSVSGEFQALVKGYAWPEYHPAPWHDRMPDYAEAVSQSMSEGRFVGGSVAGVPGIDCGGFVTILVQNSGISPDYNGYQGGTDLQEVWVKENNWQLLNSSPSAQIDTSILQPGDIAFSDGHTWIYVGEIEGFETNIASASYSTDGAGRAPMAGYEDPFFGNGVTVRWYRNPSHNSGQTTDSFTNSIHQKVQQ